ncbi:MAG: hypothetical protein P4L53_16705 [Candidatus Obscuribacterales bacterium]|jgi:hypothetical protein|nr:hypothetical protein [Candidatus Obscuribacterales bacterium]
MANISKRKPQAQKIVENRNSGVDQTATATSYAARNPATVERQVRRVTANRASRAKGAK